MAELLKPKRRKPKPKERQPVPIRCNRADDVAEREDFEESASQPETRPVNKAAVQSLSEVVETLEFFESTKELSQTNCDLVVEDTALEAVKDAALPAEDDVSRGLEKQELEPTAPLASFDLGLFVDSVVRKTDPVAKQTEIESGTRMIDLVNVDIEQEILQNCRKQQVKAFTEKEMEGFYFNEEVIAAVDILKEFSSKPTPVKDELFTLLATYFDLRQTGRNLDQKLEEQENQLKQCVTDLWTVWPDVVFSQRGKCGHQKDVVFTHTYQQARLNSEVLPKLQELVANRMKLIKSKWSYLVATELHKMCIKVFVWTLQQNCSHLIANDNLLMSITRDTVAQECVGRLSQSLGTLFYFLRKVPRNFDEEFVNDVQDHLSRVLGTLVRIGGWREHLLIAAHILCSPPGVGLWAVNYVQCPARNADHACALLSVLLRPVHGRQEFLKHRLGDGQWSVVDDDGLDLDADSGAVCENVLFQLLDQVPWQNAFENYLVSDAGMINEFSFLKLLGFCSKILEMFHGGLACYRDENYRQLSKKLGKMTRNILQMVTDQLELFLTKNDSSVRIQVEYDEFCLRTAKTLLSQPIVWQFLATAPFDRISSTARWKIFLEIIQPENCAPHNEDGKREQCHLMTTLCHLALTPGAESRKLVQLAAFHIFNVGFVYPEAWDSCSKDAQSALAALAAENSHLFDELLTVNDYFLDKKMIRDESVLIGLWQALPIERWMPGEQNLAILSQWLLSPVAGCRNECARGILFRLNHVEMSYRVQKDVAWLLVRASHCHSMDGQFTKLCLNILCKLRLHLVDRNDLTLMDIPESSNDAELGSALAEKLCAAVFVALQATSVGHFVPVIFKDGFKLVRVLYENAHYEAAFFCLDHLVTMFWDCPDSLTSCPDFLSLLGDIVTSDGLYTKVVNFLSGDEASGPVLQKFNLMIVNHLQRGGVEFMPKSTALWMRVITALPLWQTCLPAVIVLDSICKQAFIDPAAWLQVLTMLEEILPKADPVTPASPMTAWLGIRKLPPMPSLLTEGFMKCAPWFAYAAICVEFEQFESRNGLWNHLLQELWDARGQKTNLDQILKKLCSNLKLRLRSANQIAFYRWLSLAISMPKTHPLNIMVWQKLMELYLARVPGLANRGCPGEYFLNETLKKQLLEQLKALEQSQTNSAQVFQNITIWLTDPKLKDASLIVPMLPAQYNPPLLASVLNKETHLWIAMLPLPKMKEETAKKVAKWQNLLNRQVKRVITRKPTVLEPVVARIRKRLMEFGVPKSLPVLQVDVPFSYLPNLSNPNLIDLMTSWVCTVEDFLSNWSGEWKLVTQSEKIILRQAGLLYQSQERRIVVTQGCNGFGTYGACKLPGRVTLNLQVWSKDELRSDSFQQTMSKFLNNFLVLNIPESAVMSCCYMQYLVGLLVKERSRIKYSELALKFFKQLCELWSKTESLQPAVAAHVKKCLMTLGKTYVLRNPDYIVALLCKIFAMPKATFLLTLLDPIDVKKEQFVGIYELVLQNTNDTTLIDKFNIQHWIKDSFPKNQSSIISVIFNTLRNNRAMNPMLLKVLNEHLQILIRQSFPVNFSQVLQDLFQSGDRIAPETWYAVLNALAPENVKLEKFDLADIFEFSNKFAFEQSDLKLLQLQFAITTSVNVSVDIRMNKKKSLYEHFGQNTQALLSFLVAIVKSTLVDVKKSEGNVRVLEVIKVEDVFAPWLVPYPIGIDDIQQPFSADFAATAGYVAALFADLIRFLIKNLPAYENALNSALRFYLRHFCNARVDGLVLSVIHSSLVSLPWYDVRPTLLDLETILHAMNQTIPLCHSFLGNICASLDWIGIMAHSALETSNEMNTRFHVCLLHLLIKIRANVSFKNNKAINQLLENAVGFSWQLVDAQNYNSATAVFCMVQNPEVVLEGLGPDIYDPWVLRLLQTAAGYDVGLQYFHPETPQKRIIFVSTVIKCLATVAYNCKRPLKPSVISKVISRLLTDIEIIVAATVPDFQKVNEACVLLIEVLKCLAETKLSTNVEDAIIEWLTITDAKLVITGLFQCGGRYIENPIFYGAITEAAVESYFANTGLRDWQWLMRILIPYANGQVEHVLNSNSYYLTFCVYSLQLLLTKTSRNHLTMILQIFGSLKPNEELEPKLILIMALALTMIPSESDAPALLQTFSDTLMGFASDRGAGFISAIVGKFAANSFSVKFKLCCAIAVGGIRNLLLLKYQHSSDDKSPQFLEKAENNKAFLPVMPCLLNAKKDLPTLTEMSQIVIFLLKTAGQLYTKNYFSGFDLALDCLKKGN